MGDLAVSFTEFKLYEHDLIPYMGKKTGLFYDEMLENLQSDNGSGLYLLPATQNYTLREVSTGDMGGDNAFRGLNKLVTWLGPDDKLELEVTGGLIEHYRDRGTVRFKLNSLNEEAQNPVDTDESVPPDGQPYKITIESPYEGLHELEWDDGNDRTRVMCPVGHPMSIRASMEEPAHLGNNSSLYFYVPKETEVVGFYASNNEIQILNSDSVTVLDLRNTEMSEGYFNIFVPAGQGVTLWQLKSSSSTTVRLLTVPPYLARNEKELLLPKDVSIISSAQFDKIPIIYELNQNYPNPFNPTTQIGYSIPEQTHVKLEIYNIIGQRIATLLNEEKAAGRYEVSFNASGLSSGLYIYRLQTDIYTKSKSMLLVK